MSNAIRPMSSVPVRLAVSARAKADPPIIVKPIAGSVTPADTGEQVGLFTKLQRGLRWALNGPSDLEFKTREVVRDPDTRYADFKEIQAAKAHLEGAVLQEKASLASLGARGADYTKLADLCGKDYVARDVLFKMLLDGRLTSQKDLKGQGDALTYLTRMATQELPKGMDRGDLITNILEECDDPTKLCQEGKGTCAATTATVVLARKSPAEYMRLVQELASPAAAATTVNGTKLARNADWADDNDGGRTPSMRMLEPSLMDVGNFFLRYDNAQDAHVLAQQGVWQKIKDGFHNLVANFKIAGGLEGFGTNKVLEAITGDNYTTIYGVTRLNRPFAWHRIEEKIAQGKSVPCGLNWEGGGHELLLDKIEGGYCYFNNPWGETDRMTVEEFRRNLTNANLPPG
ncbi:MAG: hypothetical protein JWM80_4869 [Cyanobacteria bacterium RYN_339]|nr:hypothetical protein [Cyanobacteria bacterium RYN_339]